MAEAVPPPGDPWRRLPQLDRLLQAEGFATAADRWQNAQDLIARLAAGRRLPDGPRELQALLAPLFCRSPEEQRRFERVFGRWWRGVEGEGERSGPKPPPPEPVPSPRQPRLRPLLLALPLALAALALGLYLLLGDQPGPAGPPPPTVTIEPPREPGPGEVSKGYLGIPLESLAPRTPPEVLAPGPEARRWLAVAGWLLPALPLALLAAWLSWRRLRRRDVLRYRKGDADSPLRHITLADEDDELFGSPALRTALRRLHAPVPTPSARLDERATVERSARANGLFTPVRRQQPRVPALLVLVEFQHRGDHLAGLAATLAARLREADIEVHAYLYQGRPTRLTDPRGRGIGLPELADRHAGARLLVIGDPGAFLAPWGGLAADWTELLVPWPGKALLSTRVSAAGHAVAEGLGFATAPFGEAGLIRLAGQLAGAQVGAAPPPAQPPAVLRRQALLLDPDPEPAQRASLLAGLATWLGPRGRLLLTAAAVYPELHTGLTRLLDQALFPDDPPATRAQRLLRLAALPWLRRGHLPRWLRQNLLERLDSAPRRRIAAIYRELLARASIEGGEALRLPVAVPGPRLSPLRRLPRALKERGWRLDRWIRDLAGQSAPGAALQDRIFLDTLLRPGLLDFPLPAWLARLLPRPRVVAGGWRALAVGLLCALALRLGWQGQADWPGLRVWAADRALEVEALSHGGYSVEILHTPRTGQLATELSRVLKETGFPGPDVRELPLSPSGETGQAASQPATAARINTVQVGDPAAVAAADFAAARLRYLAWGAEPVIADRLAEPPPGADPALAGTPPPARRLRIWLATSGHGGVFADHLARPLDAAERARFRDPAGLKLPEPTRSGPGPFQVFRDTLADGGEGPAMIALPGGTFQMGSPDDEPERFGDEGPRHPVTLRPFAIGRTEVTFADYERFVKATGRKLPDDLGWGRGDRPVINVTWQDAVNYAQWLSAQTGHRYRLPSEAEWEYAARAGTETPFWTGGCIHTDQANYNGNYDYDGCGAKTGVYRQKTVPAGSLPANPWGLHEVAGNVWEWVQDCWHGSYAGAPNDGAAWGEEGGGECARRVVRGGGWYGGPRWLRSASRYRFPAGGAFGGLGFRLARDF